MHAQTPTHNLWLWPKRPPLAFSVAETSVAEMFVAEMSYIRHTVVWSNGVNVNPPRLVWSKYKRFLIHTSLEKL